MGTNNPCDFVNKPQGTVATQCIDGLSAFAASQDPIISVRHELGGLRLMKGKGARIQELEGTLKLYKELLNGKVEEQQERCNGGNMLSCGFVGAYERFIKYFGPVDSWKTGKHKPIELKAKTVAPYIIIPSGEDGSNEEMIFDTGSSIHILSKKYFEQHNQDFLSLTKDTAYGLALYWVSNFSTLIGSLNYRPTYATSSDVVNYLEGSDSNHNLTSLLSVDILQNIGFSMNFDRSKLTLDPDIDSILSKGKWLAVPANIMPYPIGYAIHVPAKINGKFSAIWLLDTGSNFSFITQACADKIDGLEIKGGCVSMNVSTESRSKNALADIEIGGHVLPRSLFGISGTDDPNNNLADSVQRCGAIGMNVLSHFNLIFDPGTFTLYLQPRADKEKGQFIDDIKPIRKDNKIAIDNVCKDTSADRAGLMKGDVIESVNGRDTKNISILEFLMLRYPKSGYFTFEIDRNGKKMSIRMNR